MNKTMKVMKHTLLIFVWITIGFAIGKHCTDRDNSVANSATEPVGQRAIVVRVYYMHTTFRCSTCNKIERMTKDLLKTQYAEAMADGLIEFKSVDYEVDEKDGTMKIGGGILKPEIINGF